jgi:copper transport protein
VAVAVLGGTGALRALMELTAVAQLWSTSYGRVLLVKTGLFLVLLGVGWLNRTTLLDSFGRLRRNVRLEIVGIAGIVIAVAVLTQLRPGRDAPAAAAAAPAVPSPPALPARDAVVAAGELGTLAVAVAREPGSASVTLVDGDADGADGHSVSIDGHATSTCGSGCYRAAANGRTVRVRVDGSTVAFDVPPRAPDGAALLGQVTRAYRAEHAVVFTERLASTPTNGSLTRFVEIAPDRLRYVTVGGPQAVVIGPRRWDRTSPEAPWVPSAQTPLTVPQPYWRAPTNVHLVGRRTLTFLDRSIPAWFRVTLQPRDPLPQIVEMTAAAHFMVDRYSRVGGSATISISPPASR